MPPLVLDPTAIKRATTPELVLTTVHYALIAHAHGRTTVPPPLHLQFPDADGDCHVKAGWATDTPDFTVKIAIDLYRNPAAGLPTDHGLVCVVSARTGQIRAILDDQGLLTAWRTAAAGRPGSRPPWQPTSPASAPTCPTRTNCRRHFSPVRH
ncbi:hypothetical protein [Saccharopolyspora shandongensis]|uniref:hypothetical protein n=1 Tax=Saccharopolyspora shandongensis TaxID=418495 RepID=UPI0033CE6E74